MTKVIELPASGKILTGRGQPGLAGFYDIVGHDGVVNNRLVKQDKPGTCFAEAIAVNIGNKDSILGAEVSYTKDKLGKSIIVSTQPVFNPDGNAIKGFDEVAFGSKRKPKTLYSQESWTGNPARITAAITNMTSAAKEQLVSAIYMSQLNGDESMHTGQFMVAVDPSDKSKITKIQRVDFGALGRYSEIRKAKNDFDPLHTSRSYSASGQLNKDYVSYLLQDPTVKNALLELWAKTDVDKVVGAAGKQFDTQLKNLGLIVADDHLNLPPTPEELQLGRKAIQEYSLELSKGMPNNVEEEFSDNLLESVRKKHLDNMKSRCSGMKTAAILEQQIEIIQSLIKDKPSTTLVQSIKKIVSQKNVPPSKRIDDIRLAISRATADIESMNETQSASKGKKFTTMNITKSAAAAADISLINKLHYIIPSTSSHTAEKFLAIKAKAHPTEARNPEDLASTSSSRPGA